MTKSWEFRSISVVLTKFCSHTKVKVYELQSIFPQKIAGHGFFFRDYIRVWGLHAHLNQMGVSQIAPSLGTMGVCGTVY